VRRARTTIYLARHGSVVGSETRRFIGHLDVPLSPRGEAESAALTRRLAGVRFAAAYSSDLARTRRTAEIVCAPHEIAVECLSALREFSMGRWEGLTVEEIRAREPEAFEAWMADIGRFQFPEGESLLEVEARAWPAFEAIAARHVGERVLVVAHGGPNRIVLCRALGLPPERILTLGQDYAGLSVLEVGGESWVLRLLNHREPIGA
jgi:broad specificity phosphatase PhoE